MNSAYTNLEQSLVAREMGARQDNWPQMVWAQWPSPHLGYCEGPNREGALYCYLKDGHNFLMREGEWVAALPWLTDDPGEQSALGLLETLGMFWCRSDDGKFLAWYKLKEAIHPSLQAPKGWITSEEHLDGAFDSLDALFMACYQRWRAGQQAAATGDTMDTPAAGNSAGKGF